METSTLKSRINYLQLILVLFLSTVISQIVYALFYSFVDLNHFYKITRISNETFALLIYSLSACVTALVIGVLLKKSDRNYKDIGYRGKITIKMFFVCLFMVIVGVITYLLVEKIVMSIGLTMYWGSANQNYTIKPNIGIDIVLLTLATVILTPLGEDTIFRGFLLNTLNIKYSKKKSIIIAIVVFSIVHLPFYGPGLTIYMIPWTLISCTLYYKYDSIYPCLLFHIMNNLFSYIILPFI